MRKNILFLFMSSVLLFSCGSDDDAQEGGNVQPTPVEESQGEESQNEEPQDTAVYDLAICGTWRIISYGTREERNDVKQVGDKLADNEKFFTMVLYGDGQMSGFSSKYDMRGRFVTGEKKFRFTRFGSKRLDKEQEKEVYNYVIDKIAEVKSYQLDEDGNLQLYYSDTEYLLLVKVAEASVEKKDPFIGKWELVMDILHDDTTFYESGSGYVEFAKSGECHWTTKRYNSPEFANVGYTFDDENIYYISGDTPGFFINDHYELNEDSTQLKMWNFQFNVYFLVDPKIPISVYRKK